MSDKESDEEENELLEKSRTNTASNIRQKNGASDHAKHESIVRVSERNVKYVSISPRGIRQEQDDVKLRTEPKKQPQVFASFCVSTGCLSFGICMAYTATAIPSMMEPSSAIKISASEATWMSSLFCIGVLFGSLSAVFLMDAIGRKASLLAFSVMSLFIGWTLLMAASQAWQLYVGRFLLGLGAGLEVTISSVYIQETTRPNMRNICGSFPQVMTALGIVICYLMGRSLAWNWLSLAALIFLIPFTFGLYYIPESPPWLVYNDEEDLAFRSMSQIRGEEYDATKEIRHIKDLLALHDNDLQALVALNSEVPETEVPTRRFKFRDIFEKSILYPFLVTLVLMFILQFSGQGAVTFYTVQILSDGCSNISAKDGALTIGIAYFISALVNLVVKNWVSRRILILISLSGMAVSQIALGAYFTSLAQLLYGDERSGAFCGVYDGMLDELDNNTLGENITSIEQSQQLKTWSSEELHTISWLPLPLLVLFTIAFNIGLGPLTWVVAIEILPIRSRGYTHTIANLTSNICWFVVIKTFNDVQSLLGLAAPFYFYGSVCFLGLIFVFIFVPETRGRTFQEIEEEFEGLKSLKDRTGIGIFSNCVGSTRTRLNKNVIHH